MNMKGKKKLMLMPAALVASVLLSGSISNGPEQQASTAQQADRVLLDGNIHTQNDAQPRAQAVAIKDGKIVYVGENKEAEKYMGPNTQVEDVDGKLVLPGIVDGHTHPGTIAYLANAQAMPEDSSIESIQAWLTEYVEDNPEAKFIVAGSWRTLQFGVKGPNKRIIDEVVSHIPVMLFDDSGHSQLLNSKALQMMGINKDSPDPSTDLSYFETDENGVPTGWVKEFAAIPFLAKIYQKGDNFQEVLKTFVDYMAYSGVTTLFDAGNLAFEDEVYSELKRLDDNGELPIHIEAVHHLYLPHLIDGAMAEFKRLKRNYEGKNLKFNSIKIHFDGVSEIRTSALSQSFSDDPSTDGGTLMTQTRLLALMLEMHREKVDLHLHTVGDRAVTIALDAYEQAKQQVKGEFNVRLTLTHLEYVQMEDVKRFKLLGVIANFTPHWYGGFIEGAEVTVGPERHSWGMRVTPYIEQGAVVSYSSDVVTPDEFDRANPFFGMQTIHTRQEVAHGKDAQVSVPSFDRISMENLVRGYTQGGAYQLRMEDSKGSIEVGKNADIIIMRENLFTMNKYDISEAKVLKTLKDGEVIYERDFVAVAEEIVYHLFF
mgnify:CR=1 FL=1